MKFKKSLATLSLGALVMLTGCQENKEYHYDDMIGEEHVKFYEYDAYADNILEVTKPNGNLIKYMDNELDDFKLEYVEITKNGNTKRYVDDKVGSEVLAKAQKQFDWYLNKIIEIKKAEGLADLEDTTKKSSSDLRK